VSAELYKGSEERAVTKILPPLFATQPELAPSPPPASARTPRSRNSFRGGWL
jgi:hypothetical protein